MYIFLVVPKSRSLSSEKTWTGQGAMNMLQQKLGKNYYLVFSTYVPWNCVYA